MSAQSDRQAARAAVGGVPRGRVGGVVRRVGTAIDRFRDGEVDASDVDRVLFQYSRAARELWKFSNLGDTELGAKLVRERPAVDWWQRGAPRTR